MRAVLSDVGQTLARDLQLGELKGISDRMHKWRELAHSPRQYVNRLRLLAATTDDVMQFVELVQRETLKNVLDEFYVNCEAADCVVRHLVGGFACVGVTQILRGQAPETNLGFFARLAAANLGERYGPVDVPVSGLSRIGEQELDEVTEAYDAAAQSGLSTGAARHLTLLLRNAPPVPFDGVEVQAPDGLGGAILSLSVEIGPSISGDWYPHPVAMMFVGLDSSLRSSVVEVRAWSHIWAARKAPQASRRDVCWSVRRRDDLPLNSLAGDSMGLALAAGWRVLTQAHEATPMIAFTGAVDRTGAVSAVGKTREKVKAAESHGITHLLVPRANEGEAMEAASPKLHVIAVDHVHHMPKLISRPRDPSLGLPFFSREHQTYDDGVSNLRYMLRHIYASRLRSKIVGPPLTLRLEGTIASQRRSDSIPDVVSRMADTLSQSGTLRVLISGDRGIGKTTALLSLAHSLLRSSNRLPIVISLASWRGATEFKAWCARSIQETYHQSSAFSAALLSDPRVLLLLDEYDDIEEAYRGACVEALSSYFGEPGREFVLCARNVAVTLGTLRLRFDRRATIGHLTHGQIVEVLNDANEDWRQEFRAAFDSPPNVAFREAVMRPFYLDAVSYLVWRYPGLWEFSNATRETAEETIVQRLVETALPRPESKDANYLSFLAQRMNSAGSRFEVFELGSVDPTWIAHQRLYRWGVGLTVGLACGGLSAGVFYTASGVELALVVGLIYMIVPLGNLGSGTDSSAIAPRDEQIWSGEHFKREWRGRIRAGVLPRGSRWSILRSYPAIGALGGAFVGGVAGLLLAGAWGVGAAVGAACGAAYGVTGAVVGGLKDAGFMPAYVLQRPQPYQRFWHTFRFGFTEIPVTVAALAAAAVSYEVVSAIVRIQGFRGVPGLTEFISYGKAGAVSLGLLALLVPVYESKLYQHFGLRVILWVEGRLPFRIVRFMDRMREHRLLDDTRVDHRDRGARWRFRHGILRDYFAGLGIHRR